MDKDAERVLTEVVALLKLARHAKKLSHEALAERSGVTRPAISFIESGRTKPSLLVCLKLARAMGISLGSLIAKAEKTARS